MLLETEGGVLNCRVFPLQTNFLNPAVRRVRSRTTIQHPARAVRPFERPLIGRASAVLILCRDLCRNPRIHAGIAQCRGLSLSYR